MAEKLLMSAWLKSLPPLYDRSEACSNFILEMMQAPGIFATNEDLLKAGYTSYTFGHVSPKGWLL